MVARKIDLDEKRVCVPTPMIQEPFFKLHVLVAPTVRDTVVSTPVVSSPVAQMNDDEEPVPQDPIETDVTDEGTASNGRCTKWGGPEKVSKS
jgi:hypothetical protein